MNNEIISTTKQSEEAAVSALRSCGVCDFYGETDAAVCPQCKEPTLQNPLTVSFTGLFMALLGAFLVLFVGLIWSAVSRSVAKMSNADPSPLYFIFSALIALGVLFTFTGVVQFYQERRNMRLINISIVLTSAFFVVAQLLTYVLR